MNASPARTDSLQHAALIGSTIANVYFWIQVLLYATGVQHVLIGVFTELLTIPCLLVFAVTFVLLIVHLLQGRMPRHRRLWAGLLLASSLVLALIAFTK